MSADASAAAGRLGSPAVPAAETGGVIHNIGYRRYDAVRLGRAAIVRALVWHSLRAAFGIGRGAKAKIFPVLLFALMCLPAVVNAVSLALSHGGQPIVSYDGYVRSCGRWRCSSSWRSRHPTWSRAICATTRCRCTSRGPLAGSTTRSPARRLRPRVPGDDRDPADPAVPRDRVAGARREPGLGADAPARPRPAVRRGVGDTAGQHRPAVGISDRQASVRHLRDRHPAFLLLDPGERARAHRRAGLRAGLRSATHRG